MAFLRKDRPRPDEPTAAATPPAPSPAPAPPRPPDTAVVRRPIVRTGIYAWSWLGIILLLGAVLLAIRELMVVVVPLILALFPAAVLITPANWLKRRLPDALAALLTLVAFLGIVSGGIALLAPQVAQELTGVIQEAEQGLLEVQEFLESGPMGFQPVRVDDLLDRIQSEFTANTQGIATSVVGAAGAVAEGVTGTVFALVVLFFYLKDGERIARWCRDLFPHQVRRDVEVLGSLSWETVGGYIRGQLLIALVDAILIGVGIWVLGVPLALPLAVLVFFGGLFPIVGAVLSGMIAVLVALATAGLVKALILLGVIVAVQQLEGDLLAPIVFNRTVQLHPLAVLAALTAGGVLMGVLGAFLAIPIAASLARAVGYVRERIPD